MALVRPTSEHRTILGPGTTVQAVTDLLGLNKTLLGVDVVHQRRLVVRDVTEADLLKLIAQHSCAIVVAVVGGQGYVLGRGNQQISPGVIDRVGSDNLIVIATQDKLLELKSPLRVDTGDAECDRRLSGYRRVVTGYRRESVWLVEA